MTTQLVTTESITLTKTKAPALPVAPTTYSRQYIDQLNNVLRLYFAQLDNFILQLNAGSTGIVSGLKLPYGAFQDSTTQTAANTTTAYPITFNTIDYSSGVTLESSSHLKVANAGLYNVQFSIQLQNTTNAPQDIDIWFRKNGTDVASSNSRYGLLARKTPTDPSHAIAALAFPFSDFSELSVLSFVDFSFCISRWLISTYW